MLLTAQLVLILTALLRGWHVTWMPLFWVASTMFAMLLEAVLDFADTFVLGYYAGLALGIYTFITLTIPQAKTLGHSRTKRPATTHTAH